MSYPFQGGPNNHPYPPSLSYPSAPPAPNTSPYPPNSSPYPSQTPYPLNPGYGINPSVQGYPPQPSGAPYPPTGAPYPVTGAPYPQAGYPPASYPSSSPYPPATSGYPPSNPGYPPSNPAYPSSSPYPTSTPSFASGSYPTGSPYPTGGAHPNLQSQTAYPVGSQAPSHHHHHHQSTPPKMNATVRPANPFNPQADAEKLRKAMKGFGTDEAALIEVLANRTNQQRQEIAKQFKTLYGKDLIKDLKSEVSGKFEQLIVALMTPIHEYYASEVKHAISGIGTNESTLIEVLCSLTNAEIYYIKQAYEKLYGASMESHLRSDTSGNFKRLLTSLCVGRRDESTVVDHAAAERDAHALRAAGELKFGTDESTFNAILCTRSFAQLQAIFSQYERIGGKQFEKVIKSEFSGDIEDGLLAIVKCVQSKAAFFAERLHSSMSGMGTNDRALIRLVVTRSETDLGDIKQAYTAKYGKSLEAAIQNDTSGDYKKLLVALVS